jgi:hypothetical protein
VKKEKIVKEGKEYKGNDPSHYGIFERTSAEPGSQRGIIY